MFKYILVLIIFLSISSTAQAVACRRTITCPTDPNKTLTCVTSINDNGVCDISDESNPVCGECATPQPFTPEPTVAPESSSLPAPGGAAPTSSSTPTSGDATKEEQVIYKLNQNLLPKEAIPEKTEEQSFLSKISLRFNSFWNEITQYFYQRPQQPPKTYVQSDSLNDSVGIGLSSPDSASESKQLNQDLIDAYGKDLPPFPSPIEGKASHYEYYYGNSQFPEGFEIIAPKPSSTPVSGAQ